MSIHFNSKSQEWCWLSNFFLSPTILDGKEYPTVEHWFQSQKFTNPILQEKIRLASTAASAKKLGTTRDPSFHADWDTLRDSIMLQGLRAKFSQNIVLANKLLSTGTLLLIEDSLWDSYWGSGRSGTGKNRMGELLMNVRRELS